MDAQSTRLVKEARAIFWPWCVVMAAAVIMMLPLPAHVREYAVLLGFWAGIPLLAALSWGVEFEQRTLSLLLSQGVERTKIWAEKAVVLIAAAGSAGFVYWFGTQATVQYRLEVWVFAGAALMITICSATFWTLFARSMIGGFVLNAFQLTLLLFVAGRVTEFSSVYSATAETLLGGSIAAGGYSFLMLWLGRRMLAAFQATGGVSDGDILTNAPPAIREAWTRLLRCRPQGALRNMIRKELHFLWPLWLLTLLFMTLLIFAAPFRTTLETLDPTWIGIASGVIFIFGGIAPVLAGTLSMGEERTLGTHPWHLTLPASANRQWFVKLAVASISSLLCVGLVFNSSRILLGPRFAVDLGSVRAFIVVWFLSVFAFWCACAVRGTVRTIFWFFPVVGALAGAVGAGVTVMERFLGNSWRDEVILIDALVSQFHPYPFDAYWVTGFIQSFIYRNLRELLIGLFAVVVVLQSRRLFRTETREGVRPLIRYLLPLMTAAFLIVTLPQLPQAFIFSSGRLLHSAILEVQAAVAKTALDPAKLNAGQPFQISLEDLSKTSPISDRARRWLTNSTVTIVPGTFKPGGFIPNNQLGKTFSYYTTVQLPHDFKCTFLGERAFFACYRPSDKFQYDRILDQFAIDQQK